MFTKEERYGIDRYYQENVTERKTLLDEFRTPRRKYYRAIRKYRKPEGAEGDVHMPSDNLAVSAMASVNEWPFRLEISEQVRCPEFNNLELHQVDFYPL